MAKVQTITNEPSYIVMPLLALALATNFFLFSVAYTNASFQNQEHSLPNIVATPKIITTVGAVLQNVGQDIASSFSEVGAVIKPGVVALIGLENYHYGLAIQTVSIARPYAIRQPIVDQGKVLGISIENPDYANVR